MHGLKVHHFINNTPQLNILHAALIYDCLGALFFPPTTPLKGTESFSALSYSFTSMLYCYSPEIARSHYPGWISLRVTGQFALTTENNPLKLVRATMAEQLWERQSEHNSSSIMLDQRKANPVTCLQQSKPANTQGRGGEQNQPIQQYIHEHPPSL